MPSAVIFVGFWTTEPQCDATFGWCKLGRHCYSNHLKIADHGQGMHFYIDSTTMAIAESSADCLGTCSSSSMPRTALDFIAA